MTWISFSTPEPRRASASRLMRTPRQKQDALRRKENGEAVREIARSYNVYDSTISRMSPQEVSA